MSFRTDISGLVFPEYDISGNVTRNAISYKIMLPYYNSEFILFGNIQCELCRIQHEVYTVQYSVCSVHYAVFSVQCLTADHCHL